MKGPEPTPQTNEFLRGLAELVGEDTIEAGGCAPPILAGHVPVREEVAAAIHQTMKRQRAARASKSRVPFGEDVVEVVAKAICAADSGNWETLSETNLRLSREDYREMARAAIAAMPPPPEREALRIAELYIDNKFEG